MRINVEWCIFNQKPNALDLLIIDPIPVLKMYSEIANAKHRKCPSYLNHYKNTYAICSPIDIEIDIKKEDQWCKLIEPKHDPKDMLRPRFGEEGDSPYPIFSLNLLPMVFNPISCKKDVYISQLEPSLEWDRSRDIRLIEGGFNISKWSRPVDFAYEQKTKNLVVKFKRGQPLCYIKFSTNDPEDVIVLNRVELTASVYKAILRCIDVKTLMPNMKLKDLYELHDNYSKQASKCPHSSLRSFWRWCISKSLRSRS